MARILIIDDRPSDRELLVTFLGYYGHTLFAARDGLEGLALALTEQLDLIVTDITMPVIDGYELARRVRAHPELSRTRLMFYTGTTLSAEVRRLAADCEVAHILTKPAEPEMILDMVNAALESALPTAHPRPSAELDRAYLRLLTGALRRNVEELKVEILAREQAEATIRRQAEVSHALAEVTHDYQATLRTVARHLAMTIGDGCAIRLIYGGAATGELAMLYHPDPQTAAFMRDVLAGAWYHPNGDDPVGRTIRTGQAVLIPTISLEQLRATIDPNRWPYPDRFTITSMLIMPMRAAELVIGAIVMTRNQPGRPYTTDDLVLLQSLADRAAPAIMNARLYQDLRAEKEALRVSEERLRQLSQRLVEVQEAERRHLARELHDEIGQMLTGLNLLLEVGSVFSMETLSEHLREAQALVAELTMRVRTLSLDLRPSMLDDLGLLPTLIWHFQRYSTQTQVQVRFRHSGLECALDPTVTVAAYRIVQEALTNVARYAQVEAVDVRVWANHQSLGIQVEDQGRGFDRDGVLAGRQSSGLTGMQERAALLGGHVIVDSAPGEGTRIIAELPLAAPRMTEGARE